jgi:hypothetical protein
MHTPTHTHIDEKEREASMRADYENVLKKLGIPASEASPLELGYSSTFPFSFTSHLTSVYGSYLTNEVDLVCIAFLLSVGKYVWVYICMYVSMSICIYMHVCIYSFI